MADDTAQANIEMDAKGLYREETFTDRRVGTLQKLTPVDSEGSLDASREIIFIGQTQILTPAGALPLTFEIAAGSLADAVAKFGDHAKEALESTMQRLEEMRREAASSLIVPGSGQVPGAGGPGGPGGGIQIP